MFKKDDYSSKRFHPLKVLFFIMVFILIIVVVSWIIMFLWNNILVESTGVKPLNLWKAAGLLILAKIILGGFGRHKASRNHFPSPHTWRKKWLEMSRDERLEAKARWKEHCKSKHFKKEEE